MNNVYDYIASKNTDATPDKKPFDKERWKEQRKQELADAYALGDKTALLVNADPAARDGYLEVMARFPERSALNSLLIYAQRPNATRIGDRQHWRDERARIRGEGFTLVEPGNSFRRDDGTLGIYYNPVRVYDQSETTARIVPPRRYQQDNVVLALVKTAVPSIVAVDDLGEELAIYNPESNTISLQKGLDPAQVFWALTSELCQYEYSRGNIDYSREAYFGVAEIATAVLAKRYGIDSPFGETPAPALPESDAREVREALSDVQDAVRAVIGQAARELDKPKGREQDFAR